MDTWTGQLFFTSNPDYETKSSYTFEVIASDGIDQNVQYVTLNINNINEAPQGIGTYWEIQEDNNLHWIDLGKNIQTLLLIKVIFIAGHLILVTGFQWGMN